jgi:hypothetical protein
MGILATLIVLVLVAGLGYGVYRTVSQSNDSREQLPKGSSEALPDQSSLEPDVRDLDIDDIVSFVGTDYIVEGRVDYNQEGYTWSEYMLADGDDIRWLCVEDDDRLEVTLWRELDDLALMPPLDEKVEYDGTTYRMFERGGARAAQQGETGRKRKSKVKFWEFESGEGSYLAVEEWGSEVEIFEGRDIEPEMLDIFPGDDI